MVGVIFFLFFFTVWFLLALVAVIVLKLQRKKITLNIKIIFTFQIVYALIILGLNGIIDNIKLVDINSVVLFIKLRNLLNFIYFIGIFEIGLFLFIPTINLFDLKSKILLIIDKVLKIVLMLIFVNAIFIPMLFKIWIFQESIAPPNTTSDINNYKKIEYIIINIQTNRKDSYKGYPYYEVYGFDNEDTLVDYYDITSFLGNNNIIYVYDNHICAENNNGCTNLRTKETGIEHLIAISNDEDGQVNYEIKFSDMKKIDIKYISE